MSAAPHNELAVLGERLIRRDLGKALHAAGAMLQDYVQIAPHDATAAGIAEAIRQFLTRGISAAEWQVEEAHDRALSRLSPADLDCATAAAVARQRGTESPALPGNVVQLRPEAGR